MLGGLSATSMVTSTNRIDEVLSQMAEKDKWDLTQRGKKRGWMLKVKSSLGEDDMWEAVENGPPSTAADLMRDDPDLTQRRADKEAAELLGTHLVEVAQAQAVVVAPEPLRLRGGGGEAPKTRSIRMASLNVGDAGLTDTRWERIVAVLRDLDVALCALQSHKMAGA